MMQRNKHILVQTTICFVVLLALVVVLAGCTRGTQGIFAELEQEEKIFSNNLGEGPIAELVVSSIDGEDSYVVRKGIRLFWRPVSGEGDLPGEGRWQDLAPPPGARSAAQFLAVANGELYAVFVRESNMDFGLFQREGDFWSEDLLNESLVHRHITGMAVVPGGGSDDDLLVVTAYNRTADSNDERRERRLIVGPQEDSPVVHTFDPTGGDDLQRVVVTDDGPAGAGVATVWMQGNGLWHMPLSELSGAANTINQAGAPAGTSDIAVFSGSTTDDWLVAVTLRGDVWLSRPQDGASISGWRSSENEEPAAQRSGTAFSTIAVVRNAEGDEPGLAVLGTRSQRNTLARGFFDASITPSSDGRPEMRIREPRGNYSSTQMRTSGVERFVVDTTEVTGIDGVRLFALTPNLGLFRADGYSGNAEDRWITE